MADKEVIINGRVLVHGTGFKESMENSSASSIVCFDETLTDGSPAVSFKLEIDRIVFETRAKYERLNGIFNDMIKRPGTITTREIIRYKNAAPFVIVKNYTGCILDGNSFEMKPEDKTAQNLSFLCSGKDEYTEDYNE